MKKTLFVMALAVVLVLAFAATASAKYAGHVAGEPYLSWQGAGELKYAIDNGSATLTDTLTVDQLSPHGGYTQTSVKCVVCHSVHRAWSDQTTMGAGEDNFLLNGSGTSACAQCHAAWGASPSDSLVAVGETYSGPHIGNGGERCANRGCHGSVHGVGQDTKYAIVAKYNLANPEIASSETTNTIDEITGWTDGLSTSGDLTQYMDAAIAAGNVASGVSTVATGDAMKAYVTGYVCTPCHANSSFTVAANGFANEAEINGTLEARTGHPSATGQFYGHAPTCEKCHDLVDVASNSTAFPHANRGIDVYDSRKSYDDYNPFTQVYEDAGLLDPAAATIATTNDGDTRYALWMTSSPDEMSTVANPIAGQVDWAGGGYNLQDGVCIKCHDTDFGGAHALP